MSYSQPGRGAQADDLASAFGDTVSVRAGLAAQGYLADDKIAGVVSLAGRPLIRLQCYDRMRSEEPLALES